jgi:hypothetical protein
MDHVSGYAMVGHVAASELFRKYRAAFPAAARDAGTMLRVSVQVGLVDRFLGRIERALNERRPVPEADWHALLATVSWPRALPAWCRQPRKPIVIDGHGTFDSREPWENDLLDGGGSVSAQLALVPRLLAVVVVVVTAGLALRALPARVAEPLTRRLDRALASLL